MAPIEGNNIYIKVSNEFKDLLEGKIEEVIISEYELHQLGYILFSREVICDNNGNFVCSYVKGRFNNHADILRKLCKGHNIIQIEDLVNHGYIFRLGVGENANN